jgi:LmbE family N-acetylglucosaminyl deacetylase
MDRLGVPLGASLGSKSIAVLSPHSDDAAFSLSGLLHTCGGPRLHLYHYHGVLALEPHTISYATLLLRKRRAVATYASQANRDVAGRVIRYALRVGKLVSAEERVWEVGFVGAGSHEREPDSADQRART